MAKKQSRSDRWNDAASRAISASEDLKGVQEEYQEWFDNLNENLHNSAMGEKLQTVCELDIESALDMMTEAEVIDLPLGFGRD